MPPSTFVWDREIPIRSAIDFDYARHQLTSPPINRSSTSDSYYKCLLSVLINNGRGSRILAFNNQWRPLKDFLLDCKPPPKPRILRPDSDAPGLIDNFCINLFSWGTSNTIAIAFQNSVFLALGARLSYGRDERLLGPPRVTHRRRIGELRRLAVGSGLHPRPHNAGSLGGIHGGKPIGSLSWSDGGMLTTGGEDGCVVGSTQSGACMDSVRVGTQVCALLWSKNNQELLTSCGSGRDSLTLWAYPKMVKTGQLVGHTSQVLYMARSPDGRSVATAGCGPRGIW